MCEPFLREFGFGEYWMAFVCLKQMCDDHDVHHAMVWSRALGASEA